MEGVKKIMVKRQEVPQTIATPGLTLSKLMPCVWCNWKGINHYELLPPDKTFDSDFYRQQLMRLKLEVEEKQPELINRKGYEHGPAFSWRSRAAASRRLPAGGTCRGCA
ncbi:hypothetical protein EVAR_73108_1 [Eumeta japonica]|uniref:Uncharacterized protein n=1 Tax=Eumeta variegata TaxID=151549 RepID=A0A4C1TDT5_EUMVA|nr:hypothetical protein EVAR_73108_1 [Eumeta japonica]